MLNAGIVHEHVERAEFFFGCADYVGNFGGLGHVGGRKSRLDAEVLFDACADLLDLRLVAKAIEHDIGPVLRECTGGSEPYARG